jgi:exonuclease III
LVVGVVNGSENILVWNARGLNARARRDALREFIVSENFSLLCIQETKFNVISAYDVMPLAGAGFDYDYQPTVDTRGGILVTWKSSSWLVSQHSLHQFSVLIKIKNYIRGPEWWLTTVYGPSIDVDKPDFLAKLHDLQLVRLGAWLLCGDVNMIYCAEDKNKPRLNRRLMGQFRRILNEAALKEIHLQGQLFMWSNEQAHPTLERIDRTFLLNE